MDGASLGEMEDYKRGSHTVWECKYHMVWTTKYRYQVLAGDVHRLVAEAFALRYQRGVIGRMADQSGF